MLSVLLLSVSALAEFSNIQINVTKDCSQGKNSNITALSINTNQLTTSSVFDYNATVVFSGTSSYTIQSFIGSSSSDWTAISVNAGFSKPMSPVSSTGSISGNITHRNYFYFQVGYNGNQDSSCKISINGFSLAITASVLAILTFF